MTTTREGTFVDKLWVEKEGLPASVAPPVPEVGLTSAPLTSLAFFLGAHCAPFNEDFLACKGESNDPRHCLKEGRKVTRCSLDLCVSCSRCLPAALNACLPCLSFCLYCAVFGPQDPNRIRRVDKHCKESWTRHWQCLDMKNMHLWECRPQEQ